MDHLTQEQRDKLGQFVVSFDDAIEDLFTSIRNSSF